jgi:GTP-binding protein
LRHLDFAPIAFVTARQSKNVAEVLDLCQHLYKQANFRVSTAKLNDALQQILSERMPSSPKGRRPKIFYVTQTSVAPPTIVLFVNNPDNFDQSFRRFVVNRFRELLPYDEVPIRLEFRGRGESNERSPRTHQTSDRITSLQQDKRGKLRGGTKRAKPSRRK